MTHFRFLGIQDTIDDESGRHYYTNCYFEGATDFICGNGKSLFEEHSREDTYFVFTECKVTSVEGG